VRQNRHPALGDEGNLRPAGALNIGEKVMRNSTLAPALQARLARTASRFAIGAALAVSVGGGAAAQEQAAEAEDDSEAIVVTGIRASLDSSAKLKRQSITIVESVSAEDIGKLPDVNVTAAVN